MKVAIVHDYLYTYGGAERVLETLVEMYPNSCVYTSWVDWKWLKKNKQEWNKWNIKTSWFQRLPFKKVLTSPLRFLAPWVWGSLNLEEYDVIISSAAWFVTKGFKKRKKGIKEICYCHTPPRYLYGFETSRDWKKSWLVRIYAGIVNPFMRVYDFKAAQRVDKFVTNSENTRARIKKFYRRDAKVIYPPVEIVSREKKVKGEKNNINYYLMVNRLVRMKRIDVGIKAFKKMKDKNLKIVGTGPDEKRLKELSGQSNNIDLLGYVKDEELYDLYANCRGVIYLAIDEDFGITPVEAMLAGKSVIGVDSGGLRESVINGKTGILMSKGNEKELIETIKKFEVQKPKFKIQEIVKQGKKFSKKRFKKELSRMVEFVNERKSIKS